MRKNERRFARFYYDDFLREFPTVYRDDAAFSTWMRLLVVAEQAWPITPELPRSVKSGALRALVTAGLLALGPSHTFALLGHDKERSRRHALAVAAANARANAPADAPPNGDADARTRREQDENKKSTPPPQVGKRADGTNPRAIGTNPRANGTSPRQERESRKRAPTRLHEILTSIQKAGES